MLSKRFVFRFFDHSNLIFFSAVFYLFPLFFLYCPLVEGNTYHVIEPANCFGFQDTARHKKTGRAKTDAYQQSQVFYDTMYKKFSRNKVINSSGSTLRRIVMDDSNAVLRFRFTFWL